MGALISPGSPLPDFHLPDLEGRYHQLGDFTAPLLILNFWSAECPWVQRCDEALLTRLVGWQGQIEYVCIASNANESAELLAEVAAERGLPLVLLDRDQTLADLYEVQTTPHYFVLDARRKLRYQGAFDDLTFRKRQPERQYLVEAVEALLAGKPPAIESTPAYGCALVRTGSLD